MECDVCGRQFTTSRDLNVHVRTHCDVKAHKCGMCDMAFSQSQNLRAHMKVHASRVAAEECWYPCSECNNCFSSQEGLSQHMNVYRGKYKCTECGKCCGSEGAFGKTQAKSFGRESINQLINQGFFIVA